MRKKNNSIKIQVDGKNLNADEIRFLLDIVSIQKIELDSLKDDVKSVFLLKNTFRVINSLSRKFAIAPKVSV